MQELVWFCFKLNFVTFIVQKTVIPEINMKHEVALGNKKLELLCILERQNEIKGIDCPKLRHCSFVASPCLLWEPGCSIAELGSVYEESGYDSFKNKSQSHGSTAPHYFCHRGLPYPGWSLQILLAGAGVCGPFSFYM